ncbi:MAG: Do family serine endopeptidase [Hyphomicrobiales bacterium]|nr:Do family serine endopeptidase [Hyphomicrobiales bacterium]
MARRPVAVAAAGVLGLGILGAAIGPETSVSVARAESDKTVLTPYGRAPISFADLVAKVRPAVISIRVKNGESRRRSSRQFDFRGMPDLPEDHPLNEFFKRFKRDFSDKDQRNKRRSRPSLAQGSGFIISADGYAVTNYHVVKNASEIRVTLDNGDKVDAKVLGGDERTDLALLKIKGDRTFPFVEFAEKPARVGDWVLAVGNPFGLGGTVTAGIVSAHNRDIGNGPYDFLQIDAAVNRGNSGGPAFNLEGKVIGVNTAIFSPSGGNVGIAFAVPSKLTKQVVAQLRDSGSVARGWLGVTIQNVTDDIAESFGLDEAFGAIVTSFAERGPASKSDMEIGDLITEVEGEKIEDSRDLARKIAAFPPKSKVKVTVLRDGDVKDVEVRLGKFPSMKKLAALQSGKPQGEEMDDLGLSLAPAEEYEGAGQKGVVITDVDPDSEAAEKGLKAGDVILEVAGDSVSEPQDVVRGIRKAKDRGRKAVLMRIQSGERRRFIALPVGKV